MGGAGRHELTIGASVTVACLARDPRVIAELPAVAQAATAAGPGHRCRTVGGNLPTRCVKYTTERSVARSRYCLKREGDVATRAAATLRLSGDLRW